jgi:hypothetical protein
VACASRQYRRIVKCASSRGARQGLYLSAIARLAFTHAVSSMYDRPAGAAVRTSLASIAARPGPPAVSDRALLQQRVFAAVDELKSLGWPIERVVIRLKEVAMEVGLRSSRTAIPIGTSAGEREEIVAEVVTWCIERYYDAE